MATPSHLFVFYIRLSAFYFYVVVIISLNYSSYFQLKTHTKHLLKFWMKLLS